MSLLVRLVVLATVVRTRPAVGVRMPTQPNPRGLAPGSSAWLAVPVGLAPALDARQPRPTLLYGVRALEQHPRPGPVTACAWPSGSRRAAAMHPDHEALHRPALTAADWIAYRRALEVALGIRAAPKPDPNAPPLVYGYIRVTGGAPSKVRYLRKCLHRFAEHQRLALANVFTDRRTPSQVVTRPGFAALLDACAVPRPVLVLVLNPSQLSWNAQLCADFQQRIVETGARLLFVHAATHGSGPLVVNGDDELLPRRSEQQDGR